MLIDHMRVRVIGVHHTGHIDAHIYGRHPLMWVSGGIVASVLWDGEQYRATGMEWVGTAHRSAMVSTLIAAMAAIDGWSSDENRS